MTQSYLDTIIRTHREAAAGDTRSIEALVSAARATPTPREFYESLKSDSNVSVIAEIKRRSPSKGELAMDLHPARFADAYTQGGARAISVLTDSDHFGGHMDDLSEARAATDLPLLRKDFIVSEQAVCDSRLGGADAILLIVAALSDSELRTLHSLTTTLELDVLVEIHDEVELERAMRIDPTVIGINQRDLNTFEVDTDRATQLAEQIPDNVLTIAESGITSPEDVAKMAEAGFDAVLVGEVLVQAGDPEAAVRALVEAGKR